MDELIDQAAVDANNQNGEDMIIDNDNDVQGQGQRRARGRGRG